MGVGGCCGCLVLPWRCLVVLCLRLLFLVPAGVPVRSGDATFPKAMDNVTVRQGESATLRVESHSWERGKVDAELVTVNLVSLAAVQVFDSTQIGTFSLEPQFPSLRSEYKKYHPAH
ncbi:hypothetical protein JRQ81_010792 [Phrynocephalus forsythii]|uniref:Uncharacterized protein n=1 Tax=Phrynocephalus forsythii TaxID=171643 RepID=A0A9Q0X779_9SAUR|nr:hypothetical protein JRQ81_010792 [Phrynocephalus forsythii]